MAIEKAARLQAKPTSTQVYEVGDTPRDIDAIRAPGCVSVGLSNGHFSKGGAE